MFLYVHVYGPMYNQGPWLGREAHMKITGVHIKLIEHAPTPHASLMKVP